MARITFRTEQFRLTWSSTIYHDIFSHAVSFAKEIIWHSNIVTYKQKFEHFDREGKVPLDTDTMNTK